MEAPPMTAALSLTALIVVATAKVHMAGGAYGVGINVGRYR